MILGHRPPKVTAAVVEQIQNSRDGVRAAHGRGSGACARRSSAAVPSVEQVRLCNTGTEAVIYSLRLARAFTGREKVIRFEGMYHGFSDAVYWSKHPRLDEAGPDHRPVAVPQGPGLTKAAGEHLIILPWNDVEALREAVAREGDSIAAILTEPVMCNTGCILPEPGYLEAMRELSERPRHRVDLRRGDHRLSLGFRRRAVAVRHPARSFGVRQRAGRRLSGGRARRKARDHETGRGRDGIDGRHIQRQRHRGSRRQCGAR